MIHPTAIIHPGARIDPTVTISPYAVIDEHVEVGPGCQIGPHVYLTGDTRIGAGNVFHAGCVIGDAPQDLKYNGERTRVQIGDRNVFREYVTVHRSRVPGESTIIGSDGFFMAHSHLGHDVRVGDRVILANGALLGGHVAIGDRAFLSGNCLVHQFVRVGPLALMQGGSAVSKDLPPFTVARGDNGICGLNTIGLRRAGIGVNERLELRRLYHILFRSGRKLREAIEACRGQFSTEHARVLLDFVAQAKRGVCADAGTSSRSSKAPASSDAVNASAEE